MHPMCNICIGLIITVASDWGGNVVPVTLSCPEVEVLILYLDYAMGNNGL